MVLPGVQQAKMVECYALFILLAVVCVCVSVSVRVFSVIESRMRNLCCCSVKKETIACADVVLLVGVAAIDLGLIFVAIQHKSQAMQA